MSVKYVIKKNGDKFLLSVRCRVKDIAYQKSTGISGYLSEWDGSKFIENSVLNIELNNKILLYYNTMETIHNVYSIMDYPVNKDKFEKDWDYYFNGGSNEMSVVNHFDYIIRNKMSDKANVGIYKGIVKLIWRYDKEVMGKSSMIEDIDISWMNNFCKYMLGEYSNSYVKKSFVRIRTLLKYMVNDGYDIGVGIFLMDNPIK